MASPHPQKCSTGCVILNQRLGGGIPCKSITELVSESGMGKTQLCLQIALQAHMPIERGGLQGSCVYIYTDFAFPLQRLQQLAAASGTMMLDSIYVQTVEDANQLLEQLNRTESFIENNLPILPVRVIIIDSIASLFRSQFENTHSNMRERCSLFYRISRKLKALARRYNIAILTTNQVRDYFVNAGGVLTITRALVISLNCGRRAGASSLPWVLHGEGVWTADCSWPRTSRQSQSAKMKPAHRLYQPDAYMFCSHRMHDMHPFNMLSKLRVLGEYYLAIRRT